MSTQPAATLLVEYPCDRHCQVELDLADATTRHTYRQMLVRAQRAHDAAHKAALAKVITYRDATIRAGVL